jgi:hypothetical protein
MMREILLVLIGLALMFLPLKMVIEFDIFSGFRGETWNFWAILCGAVLLLLYVSKGVQLHWPRKNLTLWGGLLFLSWISIYFFLSDPEMESFRVFLLYILSLLSLPWLITAVYMYGKIKLLNLVVLVAILQSMWAIGQFAWQVNLGVEKIGEPYLAQDIAGVAKFMSQSKDGKIIRAYGPYQHPNILAGTLVVGLLASFALITIRGKKRYDTLLIPLLLLGLIVSFSRSGWLAALLAFAWFLWWIFRHQGWHSVTKQTWLLPGLCLFLIFMPLSQARVTDPEDVAAVSRRSGAYYAIQLLNEHNWLTGLGLGKYENNLQSYWNELGIYYEEWEVEPVHSVPLLLLNEVGLVAFLVFIACLTYVFIQSRVPQKWLLLTLAPIYLLDYYMARQPGSIAFILVLGVSLLSQDQKYHRLMP